MFQGVAVSLVTVVGRAGTGKTRLCESLRGDVLKCGGFFLRGKFEWRQKRQGPPYLHITARTLRYDRDDVIALSSFVIRHMGLAKS